MGRKVIFWGWSQRGLLELSSVLPFVLRCSLAGCSFLHFGSAIDKLVTDLQGPKYSVHVATLALGGYVERMLQRNADFKALFNKRTQETSAKEVYDTKAIRAELKTIYERHGRLCAKHGEKQKNGGV